MKFFRSRSGQAAPPPQHKQFRIRFVAGSLALLLSGWMVGIYLFFPTTALQNRIEHELAGNTQTEVTLTGLSLLFPPGLRIQDAGIAVAPWPQPLHLQQLTLHPHWLSLFSNNPGGSFTGQLDQGTFAGNLSLDGALNATGKQIDINLPLLPGSPLSLAGTLNLFEISGNWPVTPKTQSRLQLNLQQARLTGLNALGGVPQLSLGTLQMQGSGRGNAFNLERFETEGGDLGLTGNGSLLLAQPVVASRVNLNLTVQPGATLDQNLLDLLRLTGKPERDGSFGFKISGTLSSLRMP